MRRRLCVLAAAAATIGFVTPGVLVRATAGAAAPDRLSVVTAFYPLAEAVRQVGGRHVAVSDLTPAGVEPHDLELTTDAVDSVLDADLAVVMGHDFQPAVEHSADDRDGPTLTVLDHVRRGKRTDDPHVWLDPVRYRAIVGLVAKELARVDPSNRAGYEANAARFDGKLAALDDAYRRGLADCRSHVIVTAHEAFGFLANRYRLEQHGIAGIDPDAEPDPDTLAKLSDLARRDHVTTVFTEALVSPKVARTLAREAGGLRTVVLDPLEGLSQERIDAGDDYLTVMRRNLAKLRTALRCT